MSLVITAQKEQHDGATAKSVRQTEKDICQRSTQSVVHCSITLIQPHTKTLTPLARWRKTWQAPKKQLLQMPGNIPWGIYTYEPKPHGNKEDRHPPHAHMYTVSLTFLINVLTVQKPLTSQWHINDWILGILSISQDINQNNTLLEPWQVCLDCGHGRVIEYQKPEIHLSRVLVA